MIHANMHEAKTHLSKLVRAVTEEGETVILQQNGRPVAEIRAIQPRPVNRRLIKPDPTLKVLLVAGYDPAEPLTADEWPEEFR